MESKSKILRISLLVLSLVMLIVFIILSIMSFVIRGDTSHIKGIDLNEQESLVIVDNNEFTYIADNNKKLKVYNSNVLACEIGLLDKAAQIIPRNNHITVAYVNNRNIEIYSNNGKLVETLNVPYQVIDVEITENGDMYVATKKSGIGGSNMYCYKDFMNSDEQIAISLASNPINLDIKKGSNSVFCISKDYNIYEYFLDGETIKESKKTQIPYDPIGIAFSGNELLAFDNQGYAYKFDSNYKRIAFCYTGQSSNNFAVNEKSNSAVINNISGNAHFVDIAEFKIISTLKAKNEVAKAFITDDGKAILTDYRDYNTLVLDTTKVQMFNFFESTKIVWIILAFLFIPVCMICYLNLSQKGRKSVFENFIKFKRGFKRYSKSYMFILPTFVLLGIFNYVPTTWGLFLSFFDHVPGVYSRFVGFDNFKVVFADAFFWQGTGNMLLFLVTDLLKAIIPAAIIAELIISLKSKRGQYWARILMYIPGILPGVAVMLIWMKGIYGANGLMNAIVTMFGGASIDWLGNPATAIWSLICIGFPFVGSYILFYGALMSIPQSLKEAAKLDGCSWFGSILKIDIPLIVPQLKYVFIMTFISSLQDFGRVYLTTGGGPMNSTNIPALQLYMQLNSGTGYGVAAAMGMLLFVLIFAATLFNLKIKSSEEM